MFLILLVIDISARILAGFLRILVFFLHFLSVLFIGFSRLSLYVVFDLIEILRNASLTLLVVEQSAQRILEIADRGYVLRSGEVVASGLARDLLARQDLFDTYLGRNVDSV